MTGVELPANVQICCLRGGYVVVTDVLDPLTDEWKEHRRVCTSIAEVIIHTITALESADLWEPKDYDALDKALNAKQPKPPSQDS